MKALLGERELIEAYQRHMSSASHVWMAVSLVTRTGMEEIGSDLERCCRRGGEIRILFGVDLPTEPEAIEALCALEKDYARKVQVRVFEPARKRFFHPKLAIFWRKKRPRAALVGSSNVTRGGFVENYEANVLVSEREALQSLAGFFEELFDGGHAKAVTKSWLARYRREWAKRERLRRAEEAIREKVRKIGRTGRARMPRRIKGTTLAFTGRIKDWPREYVLYPRVRRLGGDIVLRANGLRRADVLVHGDILGGKESTLKLREARAIGVPVVSEEEFFEIYKRERRARS